MYDGIKPEIEDMIVFGVEYEIQRSLLKELIPSFYDFPFNEKRKLFNRWYSSFVDIISDQIYHDIRYIVYICEKEDNNG